MNLTHSIERQAQVSFAAAAMERKRRFEEGRILFYEPCCRAHKNKCPVRPCPDSKHANFHKSDKRIRIIFGGNRSAKTTTCLNELLLTACFKTHPIRGTKNPFPGKFRVYESDFAIVEKLIIPRIQEWIPKQALQEEGKTKMEAWENSYDSKYHILQLKGGSTIDFLSYDQDSSKSESVELDMIMADEQMPERIYTGAMARLISRNGSFVMGVTPLYDLTWAMKFLDNLDPQVEVFYFSIYDNPHNSDEAIREFEASIPEHEKEARINGRFMELQGLVYKELRSDIHLLKNPEDSKPKGRPIIFAMDPHPRKPSVMTWSYVTEKGDVVFFDELEIHGSARDIASAIRRKEYLHGAPPALRIIDPAAKAQGSDIAFETDTLKEFEKEGLSFTLADNSDAGYNIVHEYLTFDPALPIGPMNRPQCFFTSSVPKTWHGMTHLLWDEWTFKKTLKDEKERVKDFKKDFPDCVRYALAVRPTARSLRTPTSVPIGNVHTMKNHNHRPVVDPTKALHKREVREFIFSGRSG